MIKLKLNMRKFNNYAFFCPVSRLHLTVSSPVGFVNEVTPAISKALKAETILDVDGVVDIETGTVKATQQTPEKPVEDKPAETPTQDEPKNEGKGEDKQEKPVEDKPKKTNKRNAKTADVE